MSIPESQLETWSRQGAGVGATQTYTSVKAALDSGTWPEGRTPEIYLQGSYGNDTHVYAESDVDVVVDLSSVFRWDLSALDAIQQTAWRAAHPDSEYAWADLHRDTLSILRNYYGSSDVTPSTNAIKVKTPYRNADVVVCIGYRKYARFISPDDQIYVPYGVTIYVPSETRWIVSHPKLHRANGVAKSTTSKNWYKPTVRMFKNARRHLVDNGAIAAGSASSYGIECLVYNVPDNSFGPTDQYSFCNVANWANAGNLPSVRRVSEQGIYVGEQPDQWSLNSAEAYVSALIELWHNW